MPEQHRDNYEKSGQTAPFNHRNVQPMTSSSQNLAPLINVVKTAAKRLTVY
jgi:hypothetical protein